MSVLTLEEIGSLTLDTIIRRNRDKVSLGFINEIETAALTTDTLEDARLKDTLDDWHLIVYRLIGQRPVVQLLGISRLEKTTWVTSPVKEIDFTHRVVMTENSLYGLGSKGDDDDVSIEKLFLLIRWLRRAGLATALDLPEVID